MEDREIVELYWCRSEDAISESDKKYGHYCRKIARNISGSSEDAEECVNDTWLCAWNHMPPDRPEILPPYFGGICRHKAINLLRLKGREKRGGGQLNLVLDELEECIPAPGGVESEVELRELRAAVDYFVSGLDGDERKIFIARYWFLYPVAEIAQRLDFSRSKVKTSLYRTRLRLREYLQEEGLC